MAGTLPNLAIQAVEPNQGLSQLNVIDGALQSVTRIFPVPVPPMDYTGFMPRSLTDLDDDDLGDLLLKTGEWASYVEFELAKADGARKSSEDQLNFIRASVRLSLRADQLTGKKLTVSDKDDMMNTDQRVVEAQSRAIYAESVYQLTRALHNKAQRNWETVSRRITQRGQQIDRIRRETNVQAVPVAAARTFRRPHQ